MVRHILFLLPVLLGGCSSLSLPNAPNISKRTDPFPADYKATLAGWLMSAGEQGVMASEPRLADPWAITEARIWYVCVRRNDAELVAFLRDGRIVDTVNGPSPMYCTGAQYSPVPPVPMVTMAAF